MKEGLDDCKVLNAYMHIVFPFDGHYDLLINSDRLNLSNRLKKIELNFTRYRE